MSDLTPLDFSDESDRRFSDWVLDQAPRLLVVKFSRGHQIPDHDDWTNKLIERQTVAGRNFLLASPHSHPAAVTMTVTNSHYAVAME